MQRLLNSGTSRQATNSGILWLWHRLRHPVAHTHRHAESGSVGRVTTRITPFGRHRPLRWRPGCRPAGGLGAVDSIATVVKNAGGPSVIMAIGPCHRSNLAVRPLAGRGRLTDALLSLVRDDFHRSAGSPIGVPA